MAYSKSRTSALVSNSVLALPPSGNAFLELNAPILKGRESLLRSIASLPKPLASQAKQFLDSRLVRNAARPMLGEYIPWIAADLLALPSIHPSPRLISGWMQIYFSVLVADDVFDRGGGGASPNECLLICLLQQRGIADVISGARNPRLMAQKLEASYNRTAIAAITDIQRRSFGSFRMTHRAIRELSHKFHIARVCIDSLIEYQPSTTYRRWIYDLFDRMLTALQLLDDITDLTEDEESGGVTVPTTLVARNIRRNKCRLTGDARLQFARLRALEQTANLAVANLSDAWQFIEVWKVSASATAHCVSLLLEQSRSLTKALTHACDLYRNNRPQEEIAPLVKEINKRMDIVAQST